jgi:ribosomal subunit interface protein
MQTQVTFRHMKSKNELQDAAIEAAKKFEKFYEGITSTDVVFSADTYNTVEFFVQVHGNTLIAKEDSEDFVKSLNMATDKMVRQLRKWKSKTTKIKGIPIDIL